MANLKMWQSSQIRLDDHYPMPTQAVKKASAASDRRQQLALFGHGAMSVAAERVNDFETPGVVRLVSKRV
jgi:predicted RNA-binding protein with PIN domain